MNEQTAKQKEPSVTSDIGAYALVPLWLIESVSASALRLFSYLAAAHADKRGKAYPSRKTMARALHVSTDTVDRALKELAAADALTWEHRPSPDGDWTSSLYTLRFVRPGSRIDAPTPSRTDAATGSRTDAAPEPILTLNRDDVEPVEPEDPTGLNDETSIGLVVPTALSQTVDPADAKNSRPATPARGRSNGRLRDLSTALEKADRRRKDAGNRLARYEGIKSRKNPAYEALWVESNAAWAEYWELGGTVGTDGVDMRPAAIAAREAETPRAPPAAETPNPAFVDRSAKTLRRD